MAKQKRKIHHKRAHINGNYLAAKSKFKQSAQVVMTQEMQRQFWIWVIAANTTFGAGQKRIKAYLDDIQRIEEEFQKMCLENGRVYADEKLRAKAEQVSGMTITQWFGNNAIKELEREERHEQHRSGL